MPPAAARTEGKLDDRRSTVRRGPALPVAERREITGNQSVSHRGDARRWSSSSPATSSSSRDLGAVGAAIAELYRSSGFARRREVTARPRAIPASQAKALVQPVDRHHRGPADVVGDGDAHGHSAFSERELRRADASPAGPAVLPAARHRRPRRGDAGVPQQRVRLRGRPAHAGSCRRTAPGSTSTSPIHEGPQTIVDHILIVGNRRTDPRVILRRDAAAGRASRSAREDLLESRGALGALGLFRRDPHHRASSTERRARATCWSPSKKRRRRRSATAAARGSRASAATGPDGEADEQLEFAPRGFFDIGRRNLGGKNRTVESLHAGQPAAERRARRSDERMAPASASASIASSARYREPRAIVLGPISSLTGAIEQGVRSSFNFARQGVNVDVVRRLTPVDPGRAPGTRSARPGRSTSGSTRKIRPPSTGSSRRSGSRLFAGALVARHARRRRWSRTRGTFLSAEGSLAARALGGQVGFVKTLPAGILVPAPARSRRPIVFATRVALGLADGFPREAQPTDDERRADPGHP